MRLPLVLLLAVVQSDERSQQFFERIRFENAEPHDAEGKRVLEILRKQEHWVGAYRTLEERFGKFPDKQELTVDFAHEGDELGAARAWGVKGKISFNLTRLSKFQKFLDDLERRRLEMEATTGRKVVYNIAPMRVERVIYHELTHVLQRNYDAPDWFLEGMSEYVSGEEHQIYALALSGRRVKDVDEPVTKRIDTYARGHLFWKWLDDRGSAERAIQLSIILRKSWKEALEEATKLSWSVIVASERDWSLKEIDRRR